MKNLSSVKGILFDLDGVLYVGTQPIAGAKEAVDQIRNRGIHCRFITNTSTLSVDTLHRKLQQFGFDIARNEIISAPQAAKIYLQQYRQPVCHLLLADDVKRDFEIFKHSARKADFVVIGDIGAAWSYPILNNAFRLLSEGAELIAIHKNRFWQTESGLQMDIGAFVTALEYASGKRAVIIGKPSVDFFKMALHDLSLPADTVAIVGDDIDADINGGQTVGLTGIQVKTGKYRAEYAARSGVQPDYSIGSVAELPDLLQSPVQ